MASPGVRPAPVNRAQAHGREFARSEKYEWLARAGLAARGVVYLVVGLLALNLAFGDDKGQASQSGALKEVAQQPFGKVLLIVLTVGLLGYAIWRLTRAALGHGKEDSDDAKERVGALGSGIVYLMLFFTSLQILLGSGSSGGGADKATGGVLGWPAGQWLVGIAGLVLIGVAAEQAHRAWSKKFCEWSKTDEMSHRMRKAFKGVGTAGHAARAVVFAMMGYFVIKAAVEFDGDKAVGLDGALAKLRDASHGPVLLGIVALGFMAFAAYSALDARYRKV